MNKDQQNPHFEVWLAAYGKRLIEVASSCAAGDEVASPAQHPEEEPSGEPNSREPE